MILTINGKSHTLVQVMSTANGLQYGLYLVPDNVEIKEFEKAFEAAENQDDFDCNNNLGVERITPYESILDITF